jgi:hypothetical protein
LIQQPERRYNSLDVINNPWIASASTLPSPTSRDVVDPVPCDDPPSSSSLKKKSSTGSSKPVSKRSTRPVLTLNENIPLLEQYQRNRYFFLESYRGRFDTKIEYNDSDSNHDLQTVYRFVSNDFGRDSPVGNKVKKANNPEIDIIKEES